MFEKFTKKITRQAVDQVKEAVTDDIESTLKSNIPLILGILAVGAFLFSQREAQKVIQNITIIHNHYYR